MIVCIVFSATFIQNFSPGLGNKGSIKLPTVFFLRMAAKNESNLYFNSSLKHKTAIRKKSIIRGL